MSVFIQSDPGLFIAFGIVLGSHGRRRGRRAVLAAPTLTMVEVADRIKIWALAAAIGAPLIQCESLKATCLTGIYPLPSSRFYIWVLHFLEHIWAASWSNGCASAGAE